MTIPMRLFNGLRITFLIFLVITLVLILRDTKENWHIFQNIAPWFFVSALCFSVLDAGIDFFVWYFYLTRITARAKIGSSFMIFVAGFATDLAPAKVGQFSRTLFLRRENGLSIRAGTAVQLNSFFVDLCAAVLVGLIALMFLQFWITAISVMGTALLIIYAFFRMLTYDNLQPFIQRIIRRFAPAEMACGVTEFQTTILSLLKARYCFSLIPVKALSWFSMGMVLFFIMRAFGQPLSICECVAATTLSSLCGTFSMIPYGMAVTEASLVGFLLYFRVPVDISVMIAFLYRLIVFWSWLVIGNFLAQVLIGKRTIPPDNISYVGKKIYNS